MGGGRSESEAPSAAAPSEADVLSHVDEWEEAQVVGLVSSSSRCVCVSKYIERETHREEAQVVCHKQMQI